MNMPKTTANQAIVDSATSAPGHLQVTVTGPATHVMSALTSMKFQQPVTPALCQQIALTETRVAGAKPSDDLGSLGMVSPDLRTAYTQRCSLDLLQHTGVSIQASQLPQDSSTTVQQVAEGMFDATT
jgi:hypothetical protein